MNRLAAWRESTLVKVLTLLLLLLLLCIPLAQIESLIRERKSTELSAVHELAQTHVGPQTLVGPLLVVPFGVAPALIAYGCGMQGLWDRVVLVFFVACGVSRLARFNVTAEALSDGGDKVKYFEGTPIPTSIVLVLLLWVAAALGAVGPNLWGGALHIAGFTLHPLVLLYALSGSLMISRLRIPKM